MTIGERVKRLRKDMSLTQKEVAEYFSIGHSTLACYETDKRQIPHDIIIKMARFFEVTTDYLLGLED
ncbi:MAG: helix-turn-helix domain-containing protein [Firmicutes bacterium]|nr:helix-turn-helix domain-containing protein [Bacillota bacterium]